MKQKLFLLKIFLLATGLLTNFSAARAQVFPSPYCSVSGISTVQPITSVKFANINQSTPTNNSVAHINYTNVTGNLVRGETYEITVKVNTGFNNRIYLSMWIDWNGNGSFDNYTERYDIGSIFSSSGTDTKEAKVSINVPANANLGQTRMRVLGSYIYNATSSCQVGYTPGRGQAQDYTVNITSGGGGTPGGYCTPSANTKLGSNPYYYINSFSTSGGIANITNNNTGAAPNGYGDYYNTHFVKQEQGKTINFTANLSAFLNFRIWVDWNRNGQFEPAEVSWTSTGTTITGSFLVPPDASPGETRMRIVASTSNAVSNPCATSGVTGEFEDYKFIVEEGQGSGGYCIPSANTKLGSNPYYYINSFSTTGGVTNITNNNTGASPNGYGDYYDTRSVTQNQGEAIDFTADFLSRNLHFRVWVDWNQDGEFDETEEVAWHSENIRTSHTGSFSVPFDAELGETRMRILASSNVQTNPCDTSGFNGEFEDYKFIVTPGQYDYIYHNDNLGWSPNNPGASTNSSTATSKVLVKAGTAVLNNNITAGNLTINSGAKLEIEKILKIHGNIVNNGNITFKSTSIANTAQFDQFTGTITGSGNVTTERFIPARRSFRFLSSAVTGGTIKSNWQENVNNIGVGEEYNQNPKPGYGTHITGSKTGTNGFDATNTGNPSMFTIETNESGQSWAAVANTDNTTLLAGKPYRLMVRGDRNTDLTQNDPDPTPTILRATGNLATGDVTQSGEVSFNAGASFFAGNPYQASVDVVSLLNQSSNVNKNYYYIWDAGLSGANGRGAYVTVYLPGGTPDPSNSTSDANGYLQPGQALILEATGGVPSVTFKETFKTVTADLTNTFLIPPSKLSLQLYYEEDFHSGETASDGLAIYFNENGNNGIDAFDAPKMSNLDENLATVNESRYFAVEQRAFPEDEETISLFINNYRKTKYVIQTRFISAPEGTTAYLHDRYTGDLVEIGDEATAYSFDVVSDDPAAKNSDRFEIRFEGKPLKIDDIDIFGIHLYPNPTNYKYFNIFARGLEGQSLEIEIVNMVGQLVYSGEVTVSSAGQAQINLTDNFPSGVYGVKITTEDNQSVSKKLIKN